MLQFPFILMNILNQTKYTQFKHYSKCSIILNISCLAKYLDKQHRTRSDCIFRCSLIRIFHVCYSDKHFVSFSPEYQKFSCEQKEKSVRKFRTFTEMFKFWVGMLCVPEAFPGHTHRAHDVGTMSWQYRTSAGTCRRNNVVSTTYSSKHMTSEQRRINNVLQQVHDVGTTSYQHRTPASP